MVPVNTDEGKKWFVNAAKNLVSMDFYACSCFCRLFRMNQSKEEIQLVNNNVGYFNKHVTTK